MALVTPSIDSMRARYANGRRTASLALPTTWIRELLRLAIVVSRLATTPCIIPKSRNATAIARPLSTDLIGRRRRPAQMRYASDMLFPSARDDAGEIPTATGIQSNLSVPRELPKSLFDT